MEEELIKLGFGKEFDGYFLDVNELSEIQVESGNFSDARIFLCNIETNKKAYVCKFSLPKLKQLIKLTKED